MKKLALFSFLLSAIMLMSLSAVSAGVYERPCEAQDICTWTTSLGSMLPLGSEDNSGCGLSYNTFWPINTGATATCTFNGDRLNEAMLYVSINNDIVNCTLNGQPVLESLSHEGCAPVDPRNGVSANILSSVKSGENVLVCELEDRGVMTHFDACVVGERAPEPEPCALTITEPVKGEYFDSEVVPIKWELSESCTPIDMFYIWYQKDGNCQLDTGVWNFIEAGISQGAVEIPTDPYHYEYIWDKPAESGQYCVKIKVTSNGNRDVSGKFNVDLAKPEVFLDVGENQYGSCEEGDGTCYVNQQTPLTLECKDEDPIAPWQSGGDKIRYRYNVNGGEFSEWIEYTTPFTFPEDSNHVLEYRCFDKVGKESPTKTKEFAVDTVAPDLTRTVGDPKIEYLPKTDGWEWYITQNTEICLSAYDPEPHPSGLAGITCKATVSEMGEECSEEQITLDSRGCFTYKEDCYHELYCEAKDNLGNTAYLKGMDLVDTMAPLTTLAFTGPYYTDKTSEWIDGVSRVVLTAADYDVHPVGLGKTYYRYSLVDDSYCRAPGQVQWEPTSHEAEGWMEYTTPFGMEESCHVIEYYSVDRLGNKEDVKHKFVFVDKTAPLTLKEVGNPSHECGLVDSECKLGWDWKVTTDTQIKLSCEDASPHPSGVKELCYRITWDGKVMPPQDSFGVSLDGGWMCVPQDEVLVQFPEECEHKLEFYCVDNVDKTSEIDSELFKVEGKAFNVPLGKKWNLISVPFNLLSTNIKEVFSDIDGKVEGVWGYDATTGWHLYAPELVEDDLTELEQGYGYWVKTTAETSLLVGGSMLSPQTVPPSVNLEKGWNLIGHYGLATKSAYCSLFSLVDTQQGFPRWSSLWGYDSTMQAFRGLTSWDVTEPGKGYWIEMDVKDSYSPSTVCWGGNLLA